jgi:hypothetical protein
MKKILLIATMAASLSGLSAFGQGNFIFGSPASYVWNDVALVGGVITRGGNFNASFLWQSGGSSTPSIASIATSVPTNNLALNSGSGQVSVTPQAWTSITNDPNFTLARNAAAGNAVVVGTVSATGVIAFNAGSLFPVTGTSASGGTVNVFMIAWDNAYATPALAAAAGAALGWSPVFAYTYADSGSAPSLTIGQAAGNLNAQLYKFGVAPIPEPATFALAGLGMAAMLIARRRK